MGNITVGNCLDILNRKRSIKEWNSTFIALILKVPKPRTVSDYRPTSLCNVSYKIITKVLTNKLKSVLNVIISDSQSAFIPRMVIYDNIVIGHECIYAMKKKRTSLVGLTSLKLDMSKAYDRVE